MNNLLDAHRVIFRSLRSQMSYAVRLLQNHFATRRVTVKKYED